ncbi:hypothetical protein D3C77_16020 [compost metagenome]
MATLFESAVDHAATILAKQNLDVSHNVDVKSSRRHQLLERVERLLAPLLMCQRGSFGDFQESVSIEDFRAYLTDRIATYHESEKYREECIPHHAGSRRTPSGRLDLRQPCSKSHAQDGRGRRHQQLKRLEN